MELCKIPKKTPQAIISMGNSENWETKFLPLHDVQPCSLFSKTQIHKTKIWKWRQITLNMLWQSLKSNKNRFTRFDSTLVLVFSQATNPTSPPRISWIRDPIHSSVVRERKSKQQRLNRVQGFGRVTRRSRANWHLKMTWPSDATHSIACLTGLAWTGRGSACPRVVASPSPISAPIGLSRMHLCTQSPARARDHRSSPLKASATAPHHCPSTTVVASLFRRSPASP
jgi:hypothetical protein